MWLSSKGSRSRIRAVGILLAVWTLSGCASLGTYNPATGRRELIWISTADEMALGRDIHARLTRQYRFLPADHPLTIRLRRVGENIGGVSDRQDLPGRFYVIEGKDWNAFTVPGGSVYVFTGLLERLKTDDEIAAVIAHEVAHGAARHTVKKFQAALGYDLIRQIVLSQISEGASHWVNLGTGALMNIIFSAYSRKDEYEADRIGLEYMRRAGYRPDAMIDVFLLLKREARSGSVPLIFRSHPYLDDRVERVKTILAEGPPFSK